MATAAAIIARIWLESCKDHVSNRNLEHRVMAEPPAKRVKTEAEGGAGGSGSGGGSSGKMDLKDVEAVVLRECKKHQLWLAPPVLNARVPSSCSLDSCDDPVATPCGAEHLLTAMSLSRADQELISVADSRPCACSCVRAIVQDHPTTTPPKDYEKHNLYSNTALSSLDEDLLLQAIQRLLDNSRLRLVEGPHLKGGQCMKYVSEEMARQEVEKFGGLSNNEILVYQKIQESDVKGLFQRDLKSRTGITNPNTIRTIIEKLMKRKLIKDFTSVHTGKKKMYILAGLEPSKELTGGNWYTNGELDSDLVTVCRDVTLKFFKDRAQQGRGSPPTPTPP